VLFRSNHNIENEVKRGNFREDLFYRLNVVSIQLPPLRERLTDVPSIAQYFLAKYNTLLRKSVRAFAEDAMALLQTYSYPGNVRELENLVERAVMLTNGEMIPATTIQEMIHIATGRESGLSIISPVFSKSRKHLLALFEHQFLLEQLKKHRGNVTAAAKASKMTRQNFQRLMTKYRIQAKSFRG
jgi:DNA-binding NtrC family response regulator